MKSDNWEIPDQSVRLEFGSFEFEDGRDSLLAIDDVVVNVPEPGTGVLIAIVALFARPSRRHRGIRFWWFTNRGEIPA